MPVIELDETKDWLGDPPAADDDLIEGLIARVSEFIEVQTGRFFGESDTHTEYLDGQGTDELWLNEPADSVTSVHERSHPGEAWVEIVAGDDDGFEIRGRRLLRKNYVHWSILREYRVIYEFGYATAPEDIRQLALDLVKLKYGESKIEPQAAAFVSYQIGDTSWRRATGTTDSALKSIPWVMETLGHWRGLKRGVA